MKTLSQMQKEFTAPLRDSSLPAFQGIDKRRYGVYQELLQSNINSLLSQNFPVCAACLGQREWGKLISSFYQEHASHTPYFHEIAHELIEYMQGARNQLPILQKHPYLVELAQYEYFELQLSLAENPKLSFTTTTLMEIGQDQPFVVWPLAHLMVSLYPLHQIKPKKPVKKGDLPTCLMVYRDLKEHVQFAQFSTATAQVWMTLLNLMQDNNPLFLNQVCSRSATDFSLNRQLVETSLGDIAKMGLIGKIVQPHTSFKES